MTEDIYQVTIEGDGLMLTRSVSKEVGDQIVIMVLTGVAVPAKSQESRAVPASDIGHDPAGPDSRAEGNGGSMDLAEFLTSHNARRNPDKIATLAYYMKQFRNQQFFVREDLPRLFQDAGERPPANLSRDITLTRDAGWIHPSVDDPDRYQLTTKGKQAVESKFSTGLSFRNRAGKGRQGRGKAKGTESGSLETPPPESDEE